jgi:hypothetical protein
VCPPKAAEVGIEKKTLNVPVCVLLSVSMTFPSNFTVTTTLGAKLEPVTVIVEPGVKVVAESVMAADIELTTVNVALPCLPLSSLTFTM